MTIRRDVLDSLHDERKYQDRKYGTLAEHHHEIGSWILIMQGLLEKASLAWRINYEDESLSEIRQLTAVGIACLEQHGASPRPPIDFAAQSPHFTVHRADRKIEDHPSVKRGGLTFEVKKGQMSSRESNIEEAVKLAFPTPDELSQYGKDIPFLDVAHFEESCMDSECPEHGTLRNEPQSIVPAPPTGRGPSGMPTRDDIRWDDVKNDPMGFLKLLQSKSFSFEGVVHYLESLGFIKTVDELQLKHPVELSIKKQVLRDLFTARW